MILKTKRLILRPWKEDDDKALYKCAKDPRVGPVAGWQVHKNVEDSRQIIKDILSKEETYAIVLKEEKFPIGSISLMIGGESKLNIEDNHGEIGYWLGVDYWGQGLVPEAVKELLRHGFEDLKLTTIWCGYFEGNNKSKRVQEKCGFTYHHVETDKYWPILNETKTEHITYITKDKWLKNKKEKG